MGGGDVVHLSPVRVKYDPGSPVLINKTMIKMDVDGEVEEYSFILFSHRGQTPKTQHPIISIMQLDSIFYQTLPENAPDFQTVPQIVTQAFH